MKTHQTLIAVLAVVFLIAVAGVVGLPLALPALVGTWKLIAAAGLVACFALAAVTEPFYKTEFPGLPDPLTPSVEQRITATLLSVLTQAFAQLAAGQAPAPVAAPAPLVVETPAPATAAVLPSLALPIATGANDPSGTPPPAVVPDSHQA